MAAGVHHTDGLVAVGGGGARAERQIALFGDGQRVHVGAQRDGRTGLATLEHTHHTGLGDAGLHLEAEALQVIGHDLRGAELTVGEFGVLVEIAPPTDHPRLARCEHRVHLGVQRFIRQECLRGRDGGEERERSRHGKCGAA